jgi:hypothetical protein
MTLSRGGSAGWVRSCSEGPCTFPPLTEGTYLYAIYTVCLRKRPAASVSVREARGLRHCTPRRPEPPARRTCPTAPFGARTPAWSV